MSDLRLKRKIENLRRDLIVRAAGLLGAVGTFYFVGSAAIGGGSAGSNNNPGTSPERPLATIGTAAAGANSKVTANSGDVICLLPGHAESITAAAGAAITKAGTVIVSLGEGSNRATLSFTTATTADIDVDAANVRFINVRFVSGIDSLAAMVDVNADNVTFEDCEFTGPATFEYVCAVDLATTKDNFTFRRCKFLQPADPAGSNGAASTGAIYCVDSENILVEDCIFDGFFETALLHNKTTAAKYITWRRNSVNQQLTDAARILTPLGTVGCSFGPDADFVPGLGYPVKRAAAAMPTTATAAIFTIIGNSIDLMELAGEVVTAIQAQACTLKVQSNPTAAGTSVDLCATFDMNAAAAALQLGITGTFATALQAAVAIVGQSIPVRCPAGTIDLVTSATNTGTVKWSMHWRPVDYSLGVPNVYAA